MRIVKSEQSDPHIYAFFSLHRGRTVPSPIPIRIIDIDASTGGARGRGDTKHTICEMNNCTKGLGDREEHPAAHTCLLVHGRQRLTQFP